MFSAARGYDPFDSRSGGSHQNMSGGLSGKPAGSLSRSVVARGVRPSGTTKPSITTHVIPPSDSIRWLGKRSRRKRTSSAGSIGAPGSHGAGARVELHAFLQVDHLIIGDLQVVAGTRYFQKK